MIDGVRTKDLKAITDERGWLMEIFRSDDEAFKEFGQVYVTTAYPGVVKAWHLHREQTDNFTCIRGKMKVVLYDAREGSKTFGEVNEFTVDKENPILITVPPGVYHGFKAMEEEMAYFLNVPDKRYNYDKPDEFRLPPDTDEIPYKWVLTPGKTHG